MLLRLLRVMVSLVGARDAENANRTYKQKSFGLEQTKTNRGRGQKVAVLNEHTT